MTKPVRVYVFIGPPSSGKSYLGKAFAQAKNYLFYEADEDYLPEYRERVKISQQEVYSVYEEFYSTVINKIKQKITESNKSIVVASAIGKEENRERFVRAFGSKLIFVFVHAPYDKLIKNAIQNEFPQIKKLTELTPENKQEITAHLTKKYHGYERPRHVTIIENDYTEKTLERLLQQVK